MAHTEKQASNEFDQHVKPVSLWADAWKRLRKNRMALISLWVVIAFIVVSLSAPLLTMAGLIENGSDQNRGHESLPPSFMTVAELQIQKLTERIAVLEKAIAERSAKAGEVTYDASTGFDFGGEEDDAAAPASPGTSGNADAAGKGFDDLMTQELRQRQRELAEMKANANEPRNRKVYLMGTDDIGRDMLSRTIYGGRISIMIGIIGTVTAVFIGVIIGAFAGYLGGWFDNLTMRFVDIMYGLPYMLVVIIIMSYTKSSGAGNMLVLFIAIALVSWLTISRVVRGQIISLKNSEFIEAARSMGATTPRIVFRHLLPNTLGIIIIYSTLSMPSFIMNESFLSFLGLGISAPDASWGTLVNEGRNAMTLRPWQLLVPAVAMTIFLFSMNFLGDGLRDALDPQSKNRG